MLNPFWDFFLAYINSALRLSVPSFRMVFVEVLLLPPVHRQQALRAKCLVLLFTLDFELGQGQGLNSNTWIRSPPH